MSINRKPHHQVLRETAELLVKHFSISRSLPARRNFTTDLQCRQAHSGSWFGANELRIFGSRNRHFHRPGLMIETQTRAPADMRYSVTAWLEDDDEGTSPSHLGSFGSLREARRFAALADDSWAIAMDATAIRLCSSTSDPAELVDAALLLDGQPADVRLVALQMVGLACPGAPIRNMIEAALRLTSGSDAP